MKVKDFIKWAKSMQEEENRIMLTKGEEYTVGDEDKFKNFKSIAERVKTTPERVALIYLLKHMDSIRNYILNGTQPSDESITGRIQDARNYLLLLGGMIAEDTIDRKYCKNCGSTLGIDCGDAEHDYNDGFCSRGCYQDNFSTINAINQSYHVD
tara:strand:- start:5957 stop:6418 length:462 start_codon:yes stop_codon:yes gene_type:complete